MDVQARSGQETAEEFEQLLNRRSKRTILTKGQWSRHLRGDVSPQGSKSGTPNSLVDRIEQWYPGTKLTFHHPVWRLLDFEFLLGPRELQQIYLGMDEDVWEYFHFDQEFCEEGARPEDLFFWKPSLPDDELRMRILKDIDGFDGVAVGLIEARMAYLAQIPMEFVFFMKYAVNRLRSCPSTMPFLAGSKGRSILLTVEGICVLHTAQLLTHVARHPTEDLEILRKEGRQPQSPKAHAAHMYESWADRCLDHLRTLSPKALRTFQMWNGEVIRYQGLFSWPELGASD